MDDHVILFLTETAKVLFNFFRQEVVMTDFETVLDILVYLKQNNVTGLSFDYEKRICKQVRFTLRQQEEIVEVLTEHLFKKDQEK